MVAHCAECGAEGITDRLKGLCPRCLFRDTGEKAPDPIQDGRFGPLEIVATVGQGGMGTIYKARQPQLDRFVALKILSPALAADPEFRDRFVQEAQVLAKLVHPHIVSIFDFGVRDGFYYLVMEYVEGVNLRQVLDSQVHSTDELLKLVPSLCEALEYAHSQGVVHRDMKPENILVDRKGQVKITDFGIAKIANPSRKITQAGIVMGTPAYMAPEQTQALDAVDHRADLYSLGAIIYEILTGKVPAARFVRPSRIARTDPRMDVILERALARDPAARFEKAGQIRDQVTEILMTPPSPQRRPSLRVLLGILVFLGIAASLAVWWNRPHPQAPVVATQEKSDPPILTRADPNLLLSVLEAIEPNILEYAKRDLPADQKIWVVDWKLGMTSPERLTTVLEAVVQRGASDQQARDWLVRGILNYDEKNHKAVDAQRPCLVLDAKWTLSRDLWRVELDRQNLPWPEPTGYHGLKPDSDAVENFWRYRITLSFPMKSLPIPSQSLAESSKGIQRRLPTLAADAARDQVMSTYRDQIASLEAALQARGTAIGWGDEDKRGGRRFGFNWEVPTLHQFSQLADLPEENRLLRDLEKRFWIRQHLCEVIRNSGVKVDCVADFRFFRQLHDKFNSAPWEQYPSRPEEFIAWPGVNAGVNGQPIGFVEGELPNGLGKTATFGFALRLAYSQVRPFLREFLAASGDAKNPGGMLVDILGCHLTIRDQQEPRIVYLDNEGLKKSVDLEFNSFRIQEKQKEVADPALRAVLAKIGPTTDEVVLIVTCRAYDCNSAKVNDPK